MIIGIITSTSLEAGLIINSLAQHKETRIQGKPFSSGILKNRRVSVCICGIGKANAAHGAALLIENFKPDFVYNIGVGGAYSSLGLSIGDIVIAEKEIYGDEGLIAKNGFHPIGEILNNAIRDEFIMHTPEELRAFKNKGNFVTVSTCTGTLKRGKELEKRFNAICENMEGAAIAEVCALSEIPVTEIRGISNIIKDRTSKPIDRADVIKAAENVQRFFFEIA